MYRKGKVVAAICHGPWVFISTDAVEGTDIIRGKKACGWLAIRDDVKNAGAEWVDAPAIREGNVITGKCPDTLPEFCQEIIEALS
jgi:protease I